MPASLMTEAHFSISDVMNAVKTFGLLPTGTAPSSAKRSVISGEVTMADTAADICSTRRHHALECFGLITGQ